MGNELLIKEICKMKTAQMPSGCWMGRVGYRSIMGHYTIMGMNHLQLHTSIMFNERSRTQQHTYYTHPAYTEGWERSHGRRQEGPSGVLAVYYVSGFCFPEYVLLMNIHQAAIHAWLMYDVLFFKVKVSLYFCWVNEGICWYHAKSAGFTCKY